MAKMFVAALACALSLGVAHAADQPSQGQKLGACSKEAAAKGLKGDARNQYLSECASAKPAPAPAAKNRLGECSKEAAAKGLKGDARNQYLSDCNKKS